MSQIPLGYSAFIPPGIQPVVESFENQFWFNSHYLNKRLPVVVSGTARDAGNTPNTKFLRMGLAMGGPIEAGQTDEYQVKQWDITATDGSQYFLGFLLYNLTMADALGNNQDRYVDILVGGCVYSDRIIIPGETAQGVAGANATLLLQVARHFLFDKHIKTILPSTPLPAVTLSVLGATPNTLTAAQAGRTFVNTGDSASRTVNLPAPLPGLGPFRFYRIAAQDVVLDCGAATFIAPGNAAAGTLTLATAGAFVEVIGYSATQYIVTDAAGTVTPA